MNMLSKYLFLVFLLFLACDKGSEIPKDIPPDLTPENPIAKGNRLLGIAISSSVEGFDASFAEVSKAGINVVELNIPWNSIETAKGVYVDPFGLLAATDYYGQNDIEVGFSLAVINTVTWEVPDYLTSKKPNSPEFISAFNNMVDWFISNVPSSVKITSISIGNEVDIVLNSIDDWNTYTAFYKAAKNHITANYPDIKVGVKTTIIGGLFGSDKNEIIKINEFSDVVMLNYYPQNEKFEVKSPDAIFEDFEKMISIFPSSDIWITEVGYQSGDVYCKSNQAKQAEFYHHLFTAWDTHKDKISFVMINWLHDQSPETIEIWKDYYGDDPALVEYLSTLGLRNYDGSDKQAWVQLLKEASARGWE